MQTFMGNCHLKATDRTYNFYQKATDEKGPIYRVIEEYPL